MDELEQLAQVAQENQYRSRYPVPTYQEILDGIRLLRIRALWLSIIGALIMFAGCALAFAVLWRDTDYRSFILAGVVFLCGVMPAIALWTWATFIRFFASLAAAQRDLAINSFYLRRLSEKH